MTNKCFACDKKLKKHREAQVIGESTIVWVGLDCYSKIKRAGYEGWQPPKGGPRLRDATLPQSLESNLWESA